MAQLTYPASMTTGASGDIGEIDSGNIVTRFVADGESDISFGRAVETDAAGGDSNCKLYEGGKLVGVAIRDRAKSDKTDGYVGPVELPVMSSGTVWVEVDSDVATDDDVYVRESVEPEVFTVTWDGDFVASNKINGTVGGLDIAEVTFTSDQATTIAAVAAAIAALTDKVASATVTDTREITVTGAVDGEDLSTDADFTVTLGASQAVDTEANVTGPSDGTDLGIFRADDDDVGSGANAVQVTRARFVTSANKGGVALLEINLP